jgi:hypothetical protein
MVLEAFPRIQRARLNALSQAFFRLGPKFAFPEPWRATAHADGLALIRARWALERLSLRPELDNGEVCGRAATAKAFSRQNEATPFPAT